MMVKFYTPVFKFSVNIIRIILIKLDIHQILIFSKKCDY